VWITGYITWKKVGPHSYLATHFVMFPDEDPAPPDVGGYVKDVSEYWLIDKNTLEGRSEGWWVVGNDRSDRSLSVPSGDLRFTAPDSKPRRRQFPELAHDLDFTAFPSSKE
jgi:hypothetical protein